eukprot:gnl/MRDRNA2_/MRDRNA2_102541_c0_seq1.p1 gnl/MRDRNA2_/MRDRNA2_102541_c0~~gnl/MRDRNA2_/MRDRNA2_102541_c0_seq1.p1  ORF type:complete len:1055 (+),score=190.16 gnl/MRDRNA2_/MRDRNA2_102541_c0_seq1:77-3241(+)
MKTNFGRATTVTERATVLDGRGTTSSGSSKPLAAESPARKPDTTQTTLRFVYRTARELGNSRSAAAKQQAGKELASEQKIGAIAHFKKVAKVVADANHVVRQEQWLLNTLQSRSKLHRLQKEIKQQISSVFPNPQSMLKVISDALESVDELDAKIKTDDSNYVQDLQAFRECLGNILDIVKQILFKRSQALKHLSQMYSVAAEKSLLVELEPELEHVVRVYQRNQAAEDKQSDSDVLTWQPRLLLHSGKELAKEMFQICSTLVKTLKEVDVTFKKNNPQDLLSLPKSWFELLNCMHLLAKPEAVESDGDNSADKPLDDAEILEWESSSCSETVNYFVQSLHSMTQPPKRPAPPRATKKKLSVIDATDGFNIQGRSSGISPFYAQRASRATVKLHTNFNPTLPAVNSDEPSAAAATHSAEHRGSQVPRNTVQDGVKELIKRASTSSSVRSTLTASLNRHLQSSSDDDILVKVLETDESAHIDESPRNETSAQASAQVVRHSVNEVPSSYIKIRKQGTLVGSGAPASRSTMSLKFGANELHMLNISPSAPPPPRKEASLSFIPVNSGSMERITSSSATLEAPVESSHEASKKDNPPDGDAVVGSTSSNSMGGTTAEPMAETETAALPESSRLVRHLEGWEKMSNTVLNSNLRCEDTSNRLGTASSQIRHEDTPSTRLGTAQTAPRLGTAQTLPEKGIERPRVHSPTIPRAKTSPSKSRAARQRRFLPQGLEDKDVTVEDIYKQRSEIQADTPAKFQGTNPHTLSTASLTTANHMSSATSLLARNIFASNDSLGNASMTSFASMPQSPRSLKIDPSFASLISSAQTQVSVESSLWTSAALQMLLEADDAAPPQTPSSLTRVRHLRGPMNGNMSLTPSLLPVSPSSSVPLLAPGQGTHLEHLSQDCDAQGINSHGGHAHLENRDNGDMLFRQGNEDIGFANNDGREAVLIRNSNLRHGIVHGAGAADWQEDPEKRIHTASTSNEGSGRRGLQRVGDLNLRSLRAQSRREQSDARSSKKGLRKVFSVFPYLTDDHGKETTKETPWPTTAEKLAQLAAAG